MGLTSMTFIESYLRDKFGREKANKRTKVGKMELQDVYSRTQLVEAAKHASPQGAPSGLKDHPVEAVHVTESSLHSYEACGQVLRKSKKFKSPSASMEGADMVEAGDMVVTGDREKRNKRRNPSAKVISRLLQLFGKKSSSVDVNCRRRDIHCFTGTVWKRKDSGVEHVRVFCVGKPGKKERIALEQRRAAAKPHGGFSRPGNTWIRRYLGMDSPEWFPASHMHEFGPADSGESDNRTSTHQLKDVRVITRTSPHSANNEDKTTAGCKNTSKRFPVDAELGLTASSSQLKKVSKSMGTIPDSSDNEEKTKAGSESTKDCPPNDVGLPLPKDPHGNSEAEREVREFVVVSQHGETELVVSSQKNAHVYNDCVRDSFRFDVDTDSSIPCHSYHISPLARQLSNPRHDVLNLMGDPRTLDKDSTCTATCSICQYSSTYTPENPNTPELQIQEIGFASQLQVSSSRSLKDYFDAERELENTSQSKVSIVRAGVEGFQEMEGETPRHRKIRYEGFRHMHLCKQAAEKMASTHHHMPTKEVQHEQDEIAGKLDIPIQNWFHGKNGDLRALLSSLQCILWPDCGWKVIPQSELAYPSAVKKAYRRASFCLHPDKLQQKGSTAEQKYVAEKTFGLLREAWDKFYDEEFA